jgi:subtilisin family serine protease
VAIKAKVAGVIFVNNEPGLLYGRVTDPGVTLPIPAFMIEQESGKTLRKTLAQSKVVQATMLDKTSDYSTMDGTSQATPHVTGVIALMKSVNKKLTPQQVKDILKQTATPLGPNSENQYGSGFVNAEAAVNAALNKAALDAALSPK